MSEVLSALAERCEKEGPSRELDCAISREMGWRLVETGYHGDWYAPDGFTGPSSSPPHYTESIDAAVTLVPKNATWDLAERGDAQVTVLTGRFLVSEDIERYGRAKTPALALCAAALKARAAATVEAGAEERSDGATPNPSL